ncbi:MAG: preprotein translocase subunit SecG [Fimbriiglobus sp.]
MALFADASTFSMILNIVVILLSLMMVFMILIQRGKGGGLAGAFGGAGGSSAFGSRAGDALMKITLYLAAVWVLIIMIHVKVAKNDGANSANNPSARPE